VIHENKNTEFVSKGGGIASSTRKNLEMKRRLRASFINYFAVKEKTTQKDWGRSFLISRRWSGRSTRKKRGDAREGVTDSTPERESMEILRSGRKVIGKGRQGGIFPRRAGTIRL